MTNYKDFTITPSQALDLYAEKYPDSTIIELELELEDGIFVYKVKGIDEEKEYKMYINPKDGSITKLSEKISRGNFTEITNDQADNINDLVDAAINDAGDNSELSEWSLEIEDGMLELTVEVVLENKENIKYKYDLAAKELIKKK